MNKIVISFVIFFLTGCAFDKSDLRNKVEKIAAAQYMKSRVYHTKNFDIFTLERISNPKKPIRIYIGGDGRAYVNNYQPSLDPTPTSNFLISLIAQDPSPNLVYIARPCQFVESKKCEEKYWTSERFSAEAIAAIDEVVSEFSDHKIEIVGYSGGALVALELEQKNIKNIRTIAGNLDLETFAAMHGIAPIVAPKINYKNLAKIPQIHFVGAEDKIIPLAVTEAYEGTLPRKNCVKVKIISGTTHNENWQKEWADLLKIEPACAVK
jgi:predicted esterase